MRLTVTRSPRDAFPGNAIHTHAPRRVSRQCGTHAHPAPRFQAMRYTRTPRSTGPLKRLGLPPPPPASTLVPAAEAALQVIPRHCPPSGCRSAASKLQSLTQVTSAINGNLNLKLAASCAEHTRGFFAESPWLPVLSRSVTEATAST